MPTPSIDQNQLAAQYGFAMAVLTGNPELKSIFDQAVAGTWTPERFQAAVRNTKWYQSTQQNQRNAQILKAADPATYAANVEQVRTKVAMMAAEMGARVDLVKGDLGGTANHFYVFGYDDNQIRDFLSKFVRYTDGRMLGQAGQYETQLRDWARKMGLSVSNQWIENSVRSVVGGQTTIVDAQKSLTEMAVSAFPQLADRLRSGQTVADIADPYKQMMASTLELNPESIDLTDPTIKSALSGTDKTGQPALQSLYDFEKTLKNDGRWLKTKNAQDSVMSTTRKILTDFGLVS